MVLNLEQLKNHLQTSIQQKNNVWELYQTAMKYTQPNENTALSTNKINKPEEIYDATSMIESEKLSRKLVNMILPTNMQWAGLKSINETQESSSLKKELDRYGDNVYRILVNSNLNKEALSFFMNMNIGTGCMRMRYTGEYNRPIEFTNLSLKNLYFLEGGDRKPKYIFYEYLEQRLDQIVDMLPDDYKPSATMSDTTTYNVMECCYEVEDGVWKYIMSLDRMNEILYETELNYCPIIITRGLKTTDSQWGIGSALKCLPNIVNLNDSKYVKRIAGRSLIKPPMLFEGNVKDLADINIELGKIAYLGQRGQNNITPLNVMGNANIEFSNIEEDKEQIREAFFATYIYPGMNQGNPATASEWRQRYQEFLEVFSPNYSMIEEEFLKVIFMNTLSILCGIGFDGMEDTFLSNADTTPTFYNKLTENWREEKINRLNQYLTNIAQLIGNPQLIFAVVNPTYLVTELAKWYEIDLEMLQDEELIEQFATQYVQTLLQQQTGQQMQSAEALQGQVSELA